MTIYAIRDLKANKFQQPWLAINDEVAIRQFKTLCQDKSTLFGNYPEDFDLMKLGQYHDDNGSIDSDVSSLVNGSSLIGG